MVGCPPKSVNVASVVAMGVTAPPLPVYTPTPPAVRVAVNATTPLVLMEAGPNPLNVVSVVAYKGYEYTESVQFCGATCHTPMEPVYVAYQHSPHSNVACVDCHVGSGASSFVLSKISGVRQLVAAVRHNYATPTPVPVENLRPARDTCEECHRPEQFTGDRLYVKTKFTDDETNTPLTTVVLMHIGGGHSSTKGIHSWHIAAGRQTLYLAGDKTRQTVDLVWVKEADGTVTNYAADGFKRNPAEVKDEEMGQIWELSRAGQVFFTMPRSAVVRGFVLNHLIHHRAHLCVYLRLNDIPVPGMYGPSGDE